jgi:putative Mn2+ efflux pump MntP
MVDSDLQTIRSHASNHHKPSAEAAQQRTGQLLVTGIALSIDNLAVGFSLGTCHVNLAVPRSPSVRSASPCP